MGTRERCLSRCLRCSASTSVNRPANSNSMHSSRPSPDEPLEPAVALTNRVHAAPRAVQQSRLSRRRFQRIVRPTPPPSPSPRSARDQGRSHQFAKPAQGTAGAANRNVVVFGLRSPDEIVMGGKVGNGRDRRAVVLTICAALRVAAIRRNLDRNVNVAGRGERGRLAVEPDDAFEPPRNTTHHRAVDSSVPVTAPTTLSVALRTPVGVTMSGAAVSNRLCARRSRAPHRSADYAARPIGRRCPLEFVRAAKTL